MIPITFVEVKDQKSDMIWSTKCYLIFKFAMLETISTVTKQFLLFYRGHSSFEVLKDKVLQFCNNIFKELKLSQLQTK